MREINNLLKAVNNRLRFVNYSVADHDPSAVSALVAAALDDTEFSFKCESKEVLVLAEQYQEAVKNVRRSIENNIDRNDPEFVELYAALIDELKKNGITDADITAQAKDFNFCKRIDVLNKIAKKLNILNEKNRIRSERYRGDLKFVHVEKHLERQAETDQTFSFTKNQAKVSTVLLEIKNDIDELCINNADVVGNDGFFKRQVTRSVTKNFKSSFESTTSDARSFTVNLITSEYRSSYSDQEPARSL